ncbi:MAG: TIGR01212 family radical SAM protein [Bacteroidaceae bacterium]|nr:TIGR01212 family radical SAM protein [Bacteroidaceae bacterium]
MGAYLTMGEYLQTVFNGKVRKIAVDAGLGCPGRCAYCSNAAFSPAYSYHSGKSISEQLEAGIRFSERKGKVTGYLAYFQSYTNTYGATDRLVRLYEEALSYPGVLGLVIATRPDCISPDIMDWMQSRFGNGASQPHQYLLVEIGVESTLDRTLQAVGRGHTWECTRRTIMELDRRGINTGAHLILGLPGETHDDFLAHARALSALPLKTLKLHQLQILKDTRFAREYMTDPESFNLFTPQSYACVVRDFLDCLRPGIALDRFVSEAPQEMVIAPRWGLKPSEFESLWLSGK